MLGLSIWRNALESVSSLIGIAYAPSALFVIAFGFVLLLLLHFSLVISRLADENKVLAQRIGLLQQRVEAAAQGRLPQATERGARCATRPPGLKRCAAPLMATARDRRRRLRLRRGPAGHARRAARAAGARRRARGRRQRVARRQRPEAVPTARARDRDRPQRGLRRRLPCRCGGNAGAAAVLLQPGRVPAAGALAALRAAAAASRLGRVAGARHAARRRAGEHLGRHHSLARDGLGGRARLAGAARRPAPREVSFASGAALAVRREAWDAVGGFDDAYFMYGEDLDLSLRLRLAGWGVGIVPAARVAHDYEFAKGAYKWFHLERNRWWTILGAYPAPLLCALLPALLGAEVALLAVAAARRLAAREAARPGGGAAHAAVGAAPAPARAGDAPGEHARRSRRAERRARFAVPGAGRRRRPAAGAPARVLGCHPAGGGRVADLRRSRQCARSRRVTVAPRRRRPPAPLVALLAAAALLGSPGRSCCRLAGAGRELALRIRAVARRRARDCPAWPTTTVLHASR